MSSAVSALPGLHTPAVGFEQPFEMLGACHERVQRTLALLERLAAHIDHQGHDAQSRRAAADVLRYFDLAAPHHHTDEERHVLPALAAHADPAVRQGAAQIKADHLRMAADWAALRPLLLAWRDGPEPCPLNADLHSRIHAFANQYVRHIDLEETVIYPAAQALLDESAQAAMGQEMAARRRS